MPVIALVPFPWRRPVKVVAPVPPRAAWSVPVVSEIAIPSDDVAIAVAFAVPPVALPTREFAATCWNFA